MPTYVPGVTVRLISCNYTNANRKRTDGIVEHVSASKSATSLYGFFNNPKSQASSHLHTDIYGRTEQYVDLDKIAWTQRAGNIRLIGYETQGDGTDLWTQPQAAEIMRVTLWIANHYGFPFTDMLNSKPTSRGVGLHRYGCDPWRVAGGEVWGPRGKVCPGNKNAAYVQSGAFFKGVPADGGGTGPTPTPQPPAGNPYNPWGWSAGYVTTIQELLRKVGYNIAVDGVLGAATSAAIKDFQGKNGLVADGSPGAVTKNKLEQATRPGGGSVTPQVGVDGEWGPELTRRLQGFFGTPVDGIISGQYIGSWNQRISTLRKGSGGSQLIMAMQRHLGVAADGVIGPNTIRALQRRMGTSADGVISPKSQMVYELQRRMNANTF